MSKSRATDTHLRGEKRARRLFLRLYAFFVSVLILLAAYFYFLSQEQLMFSQQRIEMMEYATTQARRLKQLHRSYPRDKRYPRDSRFKSAIYDLEYQKIFSTLKEPRIEFDKVIYNTGNSIHLVKILDDYYLGAKYLIIELPKDDIWYSSIAVKIALFSLASLLFLMMIGLYLARLFVEPMRNSILLLDKFIKDTTHELNTPLSAILANLEILDRQNMDSKEIKKLDRIEIGARTVSSLYEDLKFLTLESAKKPQNEQFDMKLLVESRLDYFSMMMESKRVKLDKKLSRSLIYADRKLMARVIDNLLSNAIKYNKRSGSIRVILEDGVLIIEDSGIGIPEDKLDTVFDRYSRIDNSEGGFGIGLSIVKGIVEQFDMDIEVVSKVGVGTKVILKWESDYEK